MKVNVPITKDAIECFIEHLDEVLTFDKLVELDSPKEKTKYFEDQVEFLFPNEMDSWDYKILEIVFYESLSKKRKEVIFNEKVS